MTFLKITTLAILICLLVFLTVRPTYQDNHLQIAVASNFSEAMKALAARYEEKTGLTVVISAGSSGKHYAQITHGAPFDLFFSADRLRPKLLEQENRIVQGSRVTYALGQLVLWSPNPKLIDSNGEILKDISFSHIAIANPKLAPYGLAAQQTLQALNLWESMKDKLVLGENIGQTYQFVKSGNASLGFLAHSQIIRPGDAGRGSFWKVPENLYQPIEQQAVQLTDHPHAAAFLKFMKSKEALDLVHQYGYLTD
ncbi:MAG: molybdate ABC transporter substrate-binding protein [Acidobacteria bacterium]|nr:MAG: molybdate ABC transporter substrate-binding protein [Acidobacteriota bacterium]PIE89738.1 MAG: molybdate ABC transporter substrate-binding protein [Acidobacteriota bacterium]